MHQFLLVHKICVQTSTTHQYLTLLHLFLYFLQPAQHLYGKIYYFSAEGFEVEVGNNVIVETARGVEYGKVVLGKREIDEEKIVSTLKPVIRIATEEDDKILIKKDIKDREIELYRRYRNEMVTNPSIHNRQDMRMKRMLKKIDRKIDERLTSSIL